LAAAPGTRASAGSQSPLEMVLPPVYAAAPHLHRFVMLHWIRGPESSFTSTVTSATNRPSRLTLLLILRRKDSDPTTPVYWPLTRTSCRGKAPTNSPGLFLRVVASTLTQSRQT